MATNNSLNNNFPDGLTATGTTIINGTGAATTTIGTLSTTDVSFASGSASTVTMNAKSLTIDPKGTDINIGTDATAKTITLTASSTNYTVGSNLGKVTQASIISTSTTGVNFVNNVGDIIFDITATGSVNIGTASSATINIGTASGNIPIQLGNTSSTTSLSVLAGSGGLNIGTSGTPIINIGNTTGATAINIGNTSASASFNFPNINITGTTANLIPGLYHITNSGASLCTLTLPTTCPLGSLITVVGSGGALGWIIAQNTGQQIFSTASNTTISTGTLASGGGYDCVQIECVVADTTWVIKSFKGTLIFV